MVCISKSLSGLIFIFAFVAVQMSCNSDENNPEYANAGSGFGDGFIISGGMVGTGAGGVGTIGNPSLSGTGDSVFGANNIGGPGSGAGPLQAQCGNGVVEPGEACESGVEIVKTCESLGQEPGTLGCDATCHFDVSGCTSAGRFTVNHELSSAIGTVGIVTWSTTVNPVTEAYVEFGLDKNYGMKAPVDLAEPEYRTLLLGMKGSREYHFRIVAKDGTSEYQSADYTLTTEPVTNLVQVLERNIDNESARAGGFIVTALYQRGGGMWGGGSTTGSALAFIVDADGDVVWWYSSQVGNVSRARMSYDGKHMWMISVGNEVEGTGVERVTMDGLDSKLFTMPATHDITAVTGDVMAFLSGPFNGCVELMEIKPDGTTESIYNTTQIFNEGLCHANAIRYSETEGVYTLSDLGQGDIIWINRSTRSLVQRLSEFSYDWGHHQHGHHLLDNSIVLFNNGLRITQELSLDPNTKQSALIWQYGTSYNSEILGDAQRLPNGNTNVTYSTAGRIHEVGPDGKRVMEIRFSATIGYSLWQESLYGPPSDVIL